jgi:hypothetical protein
LDSLDQNIIGKEGQPKYWSTTAYLSLPFKRKTVTYPEFYDVFNQYIREKVHEFEETEINGNQMIYYTSKVIPRYSWQFRTNIIPNDRNTQRLLVTMQPIKEKRDTKDQHTSTDQLKTTEANHLLQEGLDIAEKVGDVIKLEILSKPLILIRVRYDNLNKIDSNKWKVLVWNDLEVSLGEFVYSYSDKLLNYIKKSNIKFKLVIVDKLPHYDEFKAKLEEFGQVSEIDDYKLAIPAMTEKESTIFVVINSFKSAGYFETKDYFIGQEIPSQHISFMDKFLKSSFEMKMALYECALKVGVIKLHLQPTLPVATVDGFIYLSNRRFKKNKTDVYADTSRDEDTDILQALYIFTADKEYSDERLLRINPASVRLTVDRRGISIGDTNELIKKLYSGMKIEDGSKLDIILTERPNNENILEIVKRFKSSYGITIDHVYYETNARSKFVDGFIADQHDDLSHPYVLISNKSALLKLPTKLVIYPQLFSTYIELLYPQDAMIKEDDLEKFIWLTKKRLYRFYQIRMLSRPEPDALIKLNKDFLGMTKHENIPIKLLI